MASSKFYNVAGFIRTNTAVDGSTRFYICAGLLRKFTVPSVGAIMNQIQKGNVGADLYNGALQ